MVIIVAQAQVMPSQTVIIVGTKLTVPARSRCVCILVAEVAGLSGISGYSRHSGNSGASLHIIHIRQLVTVLLAVGVAAIGTQRHHVSHDLDVGTN